MKVLYIVSTASIICSIRFQEPIKSTYDKELDSFSHWKFVVAPCSVVACLTYYFGYTRFEGIDVLELLWIFSICLEALAILPQLFLLQRYGEVENLTGNYIVCLGAYRALYIVNWIYRAHTEPNYRHHWFVYFCGVLQTLLYADFFYYYVKSKVRGGNVTVPTYDEIQIADEEGIDLQLQLLDEFNMPSAASEKSSDYVMYRRIVT